MGAYTITGLYLNGYVKARSRRYVTKGDARFEIVSYQIVDYFGNKYTLEDFSPTSYHEVDKRIEVPVYIKPFQRRSGDLAFTINTRRDGTRRGESF